MNFSCVSNKQLSNFYYYSDLAPAISSAKLYEIPLKILLHTPMGEKLNQFHYFRHLKEKSFIRCLVIAIPIIGNLIIGIYDFINYKKGLQLFECVQIKEREGNFNEAAKLYQEAASLGHLNSINKLAKCFNEGRGIQRNEIEAVKYWRLAADRGDLEAMNHLATCYQLGRGGLVQDRVKAITLYLQASELGCVNSKYQLSECYQFEALRLTRQGAEIHNRDALNSLAKYYYHGICGVEQNIPEAMRLWRLASDLGSADAWNSLRRDAERVVERQNEAHHQEQYRYYSRMLIEELQRQNTRLRNNQC